MFFENGRKKLKYIYSSGEPEITDDKNKAHATDGMDDRDIEK